jgi:hypothetical protein
MLNGIIQLLKGKCDNGLHSAQIFALFIGQQIHVLYSKTLVYLICKL